MWGFGGVCSVRVDEVQKVGLGLIVGVFGVVLLAVLVGVLVGGFVGFDCCGVLV